ncbi:MAG: lactonase family protein [Nocardioidaceae bacterium]
MTLTTKLAKTTTSAALLALCLAGLGSTGLPTASAAPAGVVGHTYVDGNGAGANTVLAFDRHADGSLTPTAGSPFATGGAGLGRGLGSQGAVQRSADGRYLLAVNAGDSTVSVLRIGADGTLSPVGAPVPSGGLTPVSIAVHDDLVYVANAGDGGSDYTGFRLSPEGALTPLAGSTFVLPDGSGPGDVLFDPSGRRLVGTRDSTSQIDSFVVGQDGLLTVGQGSPYAAQDLGPIGAEFDPARSDQLFVTNAHAGAGKGTVSSYRVSGEGRLRSALGGPYANGQTAPCWVEVSQDGRWLYSVNTASATVSSFAVQPDGSLVLGRSTAFTNGAGAVDARLSPDGGTLTVTGGRGHVLSVFAVDGAALTELAGSPTPLPADTSPTGLVVT